MSFVYLKLSSLPEGVAQMLVDLVDLAPDQSKLSENRKYLKSKLEIGNSNLKLEIET